SPPHPDSHTPLPTSAFQLSKEVLGLSSRISPLTKKAASVRFTPSISEQRYPLSFSRGCWHKVSGGFFCGYRHYLPRRKDFTTLGPSSSTRHGWIRLAPIVQYSPLLPPVGVWAVSQSQ